MIDNECDEFKIGIDVFNEDVDVFDVGEGTKKNVEFPELCFELFELLLFI